MTKEEALEKVTDPEVKALLSKIITDQNSYITKLETQLRDTQQKANAASPAVDDVTAKYIEKNMRRDVIAEAKELINKNEDLAPYFKAVEADYDSFLESKMTKANTNVEWAVDAFKLVLGRCMGTKGHAVTQIGKTTNGTPTPQPTDGTNGKAITDVQNILKQQAPVMSNIDNSAQTGVPSPTSQVKNTRDAFKGLRGKFGNAGSNRFQ